VPHTFDSAIGSGLDFSWGSVRVIWRSLEARKLVEGTMGEGLFQPFHILLIIGIALLLFGPSKFASLGKGLGEGFRNFKSAMKEDPGKKKEEKKEEEKKA
jgi:sec-independent protein translocase protein TatA